MALGGWTLTWCSTSEFLPPPLHTTTFNVAVLKLKHWSILSRAVPDFGSGYSESGKQIRPCFGNLSLDLAKLLAGFAGC